MATPLFDPFTQRLWQLAAAAPAALRTVHVVHVRDAPRRDAAGKVLSHAHRHAVPTLVACLAGVARLSTAQGDLDLHPGSVAVVAPAAWHAEAPLRAGSAMYTQGLIFGKSDIVFWTPGRIISTLIPAQPSERLLREILRTDDPERRHELTADLLAQATATAAEEVRIHPAAWRMGYRIWHGLDQPLRAEQVLAASGVGQRQALRIFRSWFGTGPKQVIRAQQLGLAEALLHEGLPLATIASEIGFPDRPSFIRAWRQAYGTSPATPSAAPAPRRP